MVGFEGGQRETGSTPNTAGTRTWRFIAKEQDRGQSMENDYDKISRLMELLLD